MNKEKRTALVLAAQQGDAKAMDALLNSCYDDFYYYARQITKNNAIACDATQDAVIAVFRNLSSLQDAGNFKAWSRKILHNECLRYLKKDAPLTQFAEFEDGGSEADFIEEENTEFIPDAYVEREDFRRIVLDIVSNLPQEQRSAVMLYYFDELSVKEIADIQGVSEGTVKSRLNYGRKAIKTAVEDYEEKHGIKLHSAALLPLLYWLLHGDKATNPLPPKAQARIQKTIRTAAKAGARVGAASAASGAAAKIAAGIVAAVVVGGGAILGSAMLSDTSDTPPSVSDADPSDTAPSDAVPLPPPDYAAEDLEEYCAMDGPITVLDEYANWILAPQNQVLYVDNPTEHLFEGADVQEVFSFAHSQVGYRDSQGVPHLMVNNHTYAVPGVQGKVLFAETELAGLVYYHLNVITQDAQGRLYRSTFDMEGNTLDLNTPVLLLDEESDTTCAVPDRIEFYAAGSAFYAEANGKRYYARGATVTKEEDVCYLSASTVGDDKQLLTHQSSDFFMSGLYTIQGDTTHVHASGFDVVYTAPLPEGYTTAHIRRALYHEKVVLEMTDGSVWTLYNLTGLGEPDPFVRHESLSALNAKGAIKELYLREDYTLLALADNGVLYRAR